MAAKTARRSSVFHRLGREPATISPNKAICIFWLNGKCNRNPCRFLHCEMPVPCAKKRSHTESSGPEKKKATYIRFKNKLVLEKSTIVEKPHEDVASKDCQNKTLKKILPQNIGERGSNTLEDALKKSEHLEDAPKKSEDLEDALKKSEDIEDALKKSEDINQSYTHGSSCGNMCQFQNSGHRVEELTTLACLQGHTKAVMGIALPERNNKLYTGCSDGTIRIWDCNTAQCARVVHLGIEIGSIISEGVWVFIGMRNIVKVWNTESGAEYDLDGFTGLIYAMETTDDMLFAGGQDGIILAWKGSNETNLPLQPVSSLQGHTCDVVSLVVGRGWLYSGSKDHTIRVWDHKTLECVMTLDSHADTVTSLICWDEYLLSGSLDCTIRVWAMNEKRELEVIYMHNEEHDILAFCGMTDGNDKPILYCSCNDNSVHLYELPSFADRGRLFSKEKIGAMQIGPVREGLFFTGDQTGLITVWKWLPKLKASHKE